MKERIISYQELSDSRELLEAKPHRALTAFIYLLAALVVVALAWMWFGYLDVVVNATGVIRPLSSVSLVRNTVAGEIRDLSFENGDIVKKGDLLFVIDSAPFDIEKQSFETQLAEKIEKLQSLKLLKKSILEEKNAIPAGQLQYSQRYFAYRYHLEQLNINWLNAKEKYDRNNNMGPKFMAKVLIDESQADLTLKELELNRYKSETLYIVQQEINLEEESSKRLKEKLAVVNINIAECIKKSPITGRLQIVSEYNVGDYLPAGAEMLKVIPDDANAFKIELMVPNKDIANIKAGVEVVYNFAALPNDEYDPIKGIITSIPEDIAKGINSSFSEGFGYLVSGSLATTIVTDKKGNPVNLKAGMLCDARIIVSKRRILFYLLDTLDFI
ncbi:MAG: HlyD family efflux transporter periplasmic adaptor subunit [Spirochaetales bacterium]|nr:HlyD family efflux transporter periplasmic adaptor subunit [Spirochaetales bacterium]